MDRKRIFSLAKKVPIWVLLIGPVASASLFTAVFVVLPELQSLAGLQSGSDFSLAPDSNVVVVLLTGSSSNIEAVVVSSINGFQGTVFLRAISPPTIQTSISPDHVSIASGGRDSVSISFSAAAPENQSVTIVASSQFKTHSFTVEVVPRKLIFSFSPSTVSLPNGTKTNVTMTLTSTNGLSGRYWICDSKLDYYPTPQYGFATFPSAQQFPLFLPIGGSVTTTMTIVGSSPGSLTLYLDLSSSPYYYSCPITYPDWTAIYNATVT